jgi:hypothetical protein
MNENYLRGIYLHTHIHRVCRTTASDQIRLNPNYVNRCRDVQGDQIGRIFAYWAVVYFGLPFEKYKSSATLLRHFYSTGQVMY